MVVHLPVLVQQLAKLLPGSQLWLLQPNLLKVVYILLQVNQLLLNYLYVIVDAEAADLRVFADESVDLIELI